MPVTSLRSNRKATPQAVFDACSQLRREKGAFRVEDVVPITGGSLRTIAPLVSMFRRYEGVVESNDALSTEVSISLMQALDQLLQQQVSRSKQAVEEFQAGAAKEIESLAAQYDALFDSHNKVVEENTVLKERVRSLEADAQAKSQAHDAIQVKLEALSQTVIAKQAGIDALIRSKEEDMRAVQNEHARHLTESLEQQRKALQEEQDKRFRFKEKEHVQHCELQQQIFDEKYGKLKKALDDVQQEKSAINDVYTRLSVQFDTHSEEAEKKQAALSEKIVLLEETLARKTALLDATQTEKDVALKALNDNLLHVKTLILDRIETVTQTAEGMDLALASITRELSSGLEKIHHLSVSENKGRGGKT